MGLIEKASYNKALCSFIGERLIHVRTDLKDAKSIDKAVLDRYLKVLERIEKDIMSISESKISQDG